MKRLLLIASFVALLVHADLATRAPLPGYARVKLLIQNNESRPTGVRLRVTNSAGDYFAPLGHLPQPDPTSRSAGDLILGDGTETAFELHALVYDAAEIDLPRGRYTFEARKGLEYEPIRKEVEITAEQGQTVALNMKRFTDFESAGWYPGDTHLHFPDPAGVRYEMECEGLRVCSLLLFKSGYKTGRPGDGFFQNAEHFTGKLASSSDAEHFIKVGEEFRHGLLAHLIFQNLKTIVWPVSTGGLRESGVGGYDWPLMFHATEDAHSQNALVTWAHWPYPSMEAPLDIAFGGIDSIDILTTGSPFEHHPVLVDIYKMHGPSAYSKPPIEMYYHYLNCGFRLAASSGSDKMALNPPMGSARTYVKVDGPLTYDSWIDGIRKGRTFISTYPLLEFAVDGKEAGDTITLQPGKARLHVKARAQSIEPYEVLEIIHNGKVVRSVKPHGSKFEASIDDTIDVDRGGWMAARAHGPKMLPYGATWWKMPIFAHTSPVYLNMSVKPPEATESARILLEQLGYLRRWAESQANFPTARNREEALQLITKAESLYTAFIR